MNTVSPLASGRNTARRRRAGILSGSSTAARSRRIRSIRLRTGSAGVADETGTIHWSAASGTFQLAVDRADLSQYTTADSVQHVVALTHKVLHLMRELHTKLFHIRLRPRGSLHVGLKLLALAMQLVQPVLEQQVPRLQQVS